MAITNDTETPEIISPTTNVITNSRIGNTKSEAGGLTEGTIKQTKGFSDNQPHISDSYIIYKRSKNATLNNSPETTLDVPYGTFVHMQSINPANYKYIVDALVQAKVKIVNIHIYSYVLNLENEATFVRLLNKAGIDVLFRYLWIPKINSFTNVSSNLTVSASQWEQYLLKALREFDGKDGRPYVKYINFLDEPQLYYHQGGVKTFDGVDLVELYKKGYGIVKSERPDMKVVSTTICGYNEEFFNDLFTAKLKDGTRLYNYIDILYFNYFANRNNALYPMIKSMYGSIGTLQPELLEKPMWYCCGTTSFNRMPDARAETLVKLMLTAFYAGADTYNVYSFVMGGGCSQKSGNADYYGIIGPSVTNSYISLMRVSQPDRPISSGDAFNKVFLGCPDTYAQTTFDYCYFEIDENRIQSLKNEGFIISGKNYTLTKVIINDGVSKDGEPVAVKTMYEGRHTIGTNGENAIKIPANELSDLQVHNRIIVYYDRNSADVSNTWEGLEKYKTFDSFVTLQKFLTPGSSRPQITDVDDLHVACWLNDMGKPVYCIFRDDFERPKKYSLSYMGSPSVYDIYSNKIAAQLDNIELGSAPIYITGINGLKVNYEE